MQTSNLNQKSDDNSLYDKFSKCNSSGCVRCNNYERLKTDLLERFLTYEKEMRNNGDCKGLELKRLQNSIEDGLSLEVDEVPSEMASLQKPNVFTLKGLDASPWCDEKLLSETSVLEGAIPIVK